MSTSLNPDDFAALNINQPEQQHQQLDKALANASMTASFDGSLLSTGSTGSNGSRNQSATLTKEQLEERSAMLLQQERAEREKRKSVCLLYIFGIRFIHIDSILFFCCYCSVFKKY